MQILKDLFQVSGDLNGITFDVQGALWNDANSYILKRPGGLIRHTLFPYTTLFRSAIPWNKFLRIWNTGSYHPATLNIVFLPIRISIMPEGPTC